MNYMKMVIRMNNLIEEDIKFLKELSHKRNTQEKDGCADPVFWMIYDIKEIFSDDGEYFVIYADGEDIYNSYDKHLEKNIEELKEYILDNHDIEKLYIKEELNNIKNEDDMYEFINDNDYLLNLNIRRFDRVYTISDMTGPFLTKEAAKKHIKENYYHYSKDVTTYGMVGWRNPEFNQLMNIISKIEGEDFNERKKHKQ